MPYASTVREDTPDPEEVFVYALADDERILIRKALSLYGETGTLNGDEVRLARFIGDHLSAAQGRAMAGMVATTGLKFRPV